MMWLLWGVITDTGQDQQEVLAPHIWLLPPTLMIRDH